MWGRVGKPEGRKGRGERGRRPCPIIPLPSWHSRKLGPFLLCAARAGGRVGRSAGAAGSKAGGAAITGRAPHKQRGVFQVERGGGGGGTEGLDWELAMGAASSRGRAAIACSAVRSVLPKLALAPPSESQSTPTSPPVAAASRSQLSRPGPPSPCSQPSAAMQACGGLGLARRVHLAGPLQRPCSRKVGRGRGQGGPWQPLCAASTAHHRHTLPCNPADDQRPGQRPGQRRRSERRRLQRRRRQACLRRCASQQQQQQQQQQHPEQQQPR